MERKENESVKNIVPSYLSQEKKTAQRNLNNFSSTKEDPPVKGFLTLLHSISCLSWTNMQNPRRPPLQCLRFLGSSSLRQSPSERSQPKLFNILVVTGEDRDFFDFGGVEWEAGTLGLFSVRMLFLDDCLCASSSLSLENCSTGQMWGSRESLKQELPSLTKPSSKNYHSPTSTRKWTLGQDSSDNRCFSSTMISVKTSYQRYCSKLLSTDT